MLHFSFESAVFLLPCPKLMRDRVPSSKFASRSSVQPSMGYSVRRRICQLDE